MMKAAENRPSFDTADALDSAKGRRILAERQVRSGRVVIRDLAIENGLSDDIPEVSVHLSAEPAFMLPGVWRIERITSRATHHIRTIDL